MLNRIVPFLSYPSACGAWSNVHDPSSFQKRDIRRNRLRQTAPEDAVCPPRDNRSWHLLVADPGAGKTMTIRDLQKRAGGRSVLAVVAPKNNDDEQALGDQFLAALGLPIRGHWSTRKPKLMGHLHQYGTEFLIVDDAHDLSLEHLMLLKEVTDQGR